MSACYVVTYSTYKILSARKRHYRVSISVVRCQRNNVRTLGSVSFEFARVLPVVQVAGFKKPNPISFLTRYRHTP